MKQDRTTRRPLSTDQDGFGPLQEFYVLEPTRCPYLENKMERKLLTEISGPLAQSTYDRLTLAGLRRSHRFAYRPACENCDACIPVRVVVDRFQASKSLRRIARANADLSVALGSNKTSEEQFALFDRYIESRHGDGEMAGMAEQEYRSMVESSDIDTRVAEFRDSEGRLVAVCLLDWVSDGPSAVYSFFEPAEARRSLGTFVVLWLIRRAEQAAARHVYLGYWIENSRKMAYKTRFQPLEGLIDGTWQILSPTSHSFAARPEN